MIFKGSFQLKLFYSNLQKIHILGHKTPWLLQEKKRQEGDNLGLPLGHAGATASEHWERAEMEQPWARSYGATAAGKEVAARLALVLLIVVAKIK